MPQSSIGFMVALAIFVCVAFLAGKRYRTVRPGEDLGHWMDAHHLLDWMRYKH
jgi:hypothetical protein